jgi:transcriptional regulator with XRE-family HTH domain
MNKQNGLTLGQFIKARREQLNIRAGNFARKIGVNRSYVYRLQSDLQRGISFEFIVAIASVLQVPLDVLAELHTRTFVKRWGDE